MKKAKSARKRPANRHHVKRIARKKKLMKSRKRFN
jgi:hypothetical protein